MLIKEKYIQKLSGPLLAIYWVTLFISTHVPVPDIPQLPESSDKVMHFVAYAGLTFLFFLWRSSKGPLSFLDVIFITGLIALYATLDELLQIPFSRFCDPLDALADWAGILIGFTLFLFWSRIGSKLLVQKEASNDLYSGVRQ